MNHYRRVSKALDGCESVLNVGCGTGAYTNELKIRRGGLDAYKPDLDKAQLEQRYHGLAQKLLPTIPHHSYDAVLGMDFLEHLDDEDAYFVIWEMKRIARKRVALFLPLGEHYQPGTAENPYQEHRSSWLVKDLIAFGFEVFPYLGFHGPGRDAMFAVWQR